MMLPPETVAEHLDRLAKPRGSLGKLERLAIDLARIQGTLRPETRPRSLLIFAGDHGVVADGVGIWPSDVTASMIGLIASGRACCSALAAASATEVALVDVGSLIEAAPLTEIYRDRRIARGTASLARGPAMSPAEFWSAWQAGEAEVARAAADGIRVLALGEIGIGNTTAAACLIALGTGGDTDALVGPGAGATDASLARKRNVVAEAVSRARQTIKTDPVAAMAAVAGYEIVAMAGAIAAASQHEIPIVIDGVVSGAAAIVAQAVDPSALECVIASHNGAEPAHGKALEHLGLEPYLEWDLRLGEGTGALLLMPMLDAAAALLTGVAKLEEVTGPASGATS
ncbi:MAG: nicotinate-nucleotide--dimethylbenzimidazole phosphoribosyltransferase [Hyphomicrobium sp.]|nr:nicotinate-nucleotide--dimethylbenzimidazole phosphoribosyltransferase [Hyphomicrobium sp.]